jgi:N-formylglutamate amidohydrolase
MKLSLLISVPHAGILTPPEVEHISLLTSDQIVTDGDEGAAEIYALEAEVEAFITSHIARAFVDLNRPEHDRNKDGVVKTHTCWNERIYKTPLLENEIELLLENYYRPYHRRLSELGPSVRLGVDCHTMSAKAPPIAANPGEERPPLCLSNAYGTCPDSWFHSLAECLERSFERNVSLNHPFKGGHIIRSHSSELPWIQLELSRAPFLNNSEKRARVLEALSKWTRNVHSTG